MQYVSYCPATIAITLVSIFSISHDVAHSLKGHVDNDQKKLSLKLSVEEKSSPFCFIYSPMQRQAIIGSSNILELVYPLSKFEGAE